MIMKQSKLIFAVCVVLCLFGIVGKSQAAYGNADTDVVGNNGNGDNKGEAYKPILEIGKSWVYQRYFFPDSTMKHPKPFFKATVESKSIEDGKEIFKVLITDEYDFEPDYALAYEENGILYYFSTEHMEYVPMMDFNLEVGETILEGRRKIIKKEYEMIEGTSRCVITFQNGHIWIEGIGSPYNLSITEMPIALSLRSKIIQCSMGDKVIFKDDNLNAYLSVPYIPREYSKDDAIYDLDGNYVDNPQKGHIYIQNSKKIVWK